MTRPRGQEQKTVIGLALVAVFAEAAYAVINSLALPMFVDEVLHATVYLGLIGGSFMLVEAVLKSPMGALSDRVGRRIILIVTPLVSALAALALPMVYAPVDHAKVAFLVLVRCLDGVAAAGLWTAMYAAVADQVPEERRASAMSTLTVSYLFGLGAGVPLGGWATETFSVRVAFVIVAGLFVLTSVAAVLLVPRAERHVPVEPEPHAGLIEGELRVVTHTEHAEGTSLAGFLQSLRRAPHLLTMAVIVFLGIGLLYQTAPLIARREFHLDPLTYGKLFVIPAALIGILTVPLGRLGDRWGPPRSVHLGLALAAAALWALALLPKTQLLLVLGASVLGIGSVIVVPSWLAVITSVADPQHRGAMIGAVATAQGIGAFLGVLIGPLLFKADRLAEFLSLSWPGGRVTPYLLPVVGAAVLVTVTWLASLVVVRVRNPVQV